MNLSSYPLDLKLRHTFQIARETRDIQNNVVVMLRDGDGVIGFGEAAPTRFFGEDVRSVARALGQSVDLLKQANPFHLEDITHLLKERFPGDASARAAIDIALYDLIGKKLNIPLYQLLGLKQPTEKVTSFTIGIDTLEKMCRKVDEAKDFPVLKIKAGFKEDMETLRELRKITKAVFRIDANTGWTLSEAREKLTLMENLGVELVEQPFPVGSIELLQKIRHYVKIPIFVDEDVKTARDIPAFSGAVDGINIKLMKCGGIREAIRMIHTARAHGLKIMIGCNIESSVSITAAAHLATLVDYIDLDGHLLVVNDPYTGVTADKGRLTLPAGDGLGVSPRSSETLSSLCKSDADKPFIRS
ncbi:MAG: dipeptide epimerase [Candidatus Brocadia sp.]|uniref:Dipeptide epimerase n=1 Tax=Candidatus Brocadia fulgida TaxID=380242 RepID=A0A0M2UVJ9_9BACT|nr:MAG: chloromuconate cycloisomerase [Candidatus Brocadia fulgida]MBV6467697.1 L-Ala-D/L-Glu epimerase [Anaerolineales bacterium]UJS20465.1 MAG: dipeptide epimerase [Candidatus Brocadia sp.]